MIKRLLKVLKMIKRLLKVLKMILKMIQMIQIWCLLLLFFSEALTWVWEHSGDHFVWAIAGIKAES